MRVDLDIDTLAHLGEGAGRSGEGTVYVRGALAGERVRVEVDGDRGRLLEVLGPSADRVEAVCRHFPTCGGCALQHMAQHAYHDWKRDLVADALRRQGIETEIEPVAVVPDSGRRRATFAARRTKRGVRFGFNAHRSDEIVDLEECPVLMPDIVSAIPVLREAVAPMLTRRGVADFQVTMSRAGLDVAVTGGRAADDLESRERLATMAERLDLARLTWDGDVIAERRPPHHVFGDIPVIPPPGGFLQAVEAAERAIADRVREALADSESVVDLFSGSGALSLPSAARVRIHAVEADEAALAALSHAANHAQGIKPVSVEQRDLFRRPLLAGELNEFNAVLFDPPRAGARAQCQEIADSDIPLVVAVSCNATTFARDARILVDSGYRLERVTPIDQFVYTPHIELVAVLTRH